MPSVNPIYPNLVVFAGQNTQSGGTYNQDQNYIWLVDRSKNPVEPVPLETGAPRSGNFDPKWQGRAPGGRRMANGSCSSSNRASSQGQYAIYLYNCGDRSTAGTQVTDPKWNMNHAKWYPNGFPGGPSGNKTLVVASFQPGNGGTPAWPYGIANLDVSPIVG